MGPAGADGADGATGPMGPAGADGEDGATGPMGPAGADGEDGATGPMGPAGADGEDGATGPMGPAGADGEDGADGSDGSDGTDGTDGTDGATGPAGPVFSNYRSGCATLRSSGTPTGQTQVAFSSAMPNANYTVAVVFTSDTSFGINFEDVFVSNKTATGFRITFVDLGGDPINANANTTVDWMVIPTN